jgi:hypothetical protein
MQQITTKPNTIKTINPLYIQQKQINRLRTKSNIQQFIINCLVIAQLVTMVYMVVDNMNFNRTMSYSPLESLSIEELELIGE